MQPNQPVFPQPQITQSTPSPSQRSRTMLVVLTILGAVLFGGLLFAGGLLLGKNSAKQASDAKVTKVNQEVDSLREQLASVGEPITQPGVQYLTITEWGIRVPLEEKFQDVKYRIRTRLNADFIEIYSPTMAGIATCRDYQGEIGTIERAAAGSVPVANANVVGIGKYLYMYKSKTETCTTNPADIETPYKASVLKQFALLELSGTMQKDNTSTVEPDTPVSSEPSQR